MLGLILTSALFYILWTTPFKKVAISHYSGVVAWIIHGMICYNNLFDKSGWMLNIPNSILLVSWLAVLVVLIFKLTSQWIKIPITFFVLSSFLLIKNQQTTLSYKEFSWQLDLHISLSMLAYAILVVATLFAISLWVHIKKIKNSQFDGNNIMSIMDEEKKLFQLIMLGWLILTTSLLSGVIFIDNFMAQHLGHKVVFSLLAWLTFGLLILGRLSKGWRGEKLIILTIVGMFALATGYLGSKIVMEWIL